MRTSTGTVGGRLIAAALAALLLGACGRPAPANEAQAAAPDPAAQSTTPSSATVDAAVPSGEGDQTDAMDGSTDASAGNAVDSGAMDEGAMDDGATNDGAMDDASAAPADATATVVTAPVLTPDQVVGVVDPTPGMAGVKITSQNPIVAPTPTTAPPAVPDVTTPAGTGGVHVVQPGEALSVIAEMYGVSVQAIVDANGLVDPDNVTAGEELQIPAPSSG